MFLGHNVIPVVVKHRDGSKSEYSVFARNILHKTQVRKTPAEVREALLRTGSIKCSNANVETKSQVQDLLLDTERA